MVGWFSNGWMIFQELKNPLYTMVGCLSNFLYLISMVGSVSITYIYFLLNGWLAQSMVGWANHDFPGIGKPFIYNGWMPKWLFISYFNGWIIFHNFYILSSQWLAGSVNGWMIFHFALFYFSVGWNKMVG